MNRLEILLLMIPKAKDDFDAVEKFRLVSPYQIKEVIGQLLPWLQDGNWPIARDIADILSLHLIEIEDDLIDVLNGNDDVWKYWCIMLLLRNPAVVQMPNLLKALGRVAHHPTDGEVSEEVNLVASEILNSLSK